MTQFIDRRLNGKNRSAVNRQRFIQRFKNQIKAAVSDAIHKRNITDIDKGENIILPNKDISEPVIHHGIGGIREYTLPGNKDFLRGDKIKRPSQAGAGGGEESEASNTGLGEDNFVFYLTKEEFLEVFFEELALPDMIKTRLAKNPTIENVRMGYSTTGTPPNINILRSFRNALGRRVAFKGNYTNELTKLLALKSEKENQLELIKSMQFNDIQLNELYNELLLLKNKITVIESKKNHIPFIDNVDLRYNSRATRPKITTQAVMFCIMDVSGSMDEKKKEIAKRFFILLYLFLKKSYKKITIIFIRHHTTAKEVDEQEFFYSRETGGTVVSSALDLVKKIIAERFPTADWNIYVAQATDGDNWNDDSPLCADILTKYIVPYVQYYAYIEIMPRHHQSLWRTYANLQKQFKHFSMRSIGAINEIYPVFHELFKRRAS